MDKTMRKNRLELKRFLAEALREAKKNGGTATYEKVVGSFPMTAEITSRNEAIQAKLSSYPFMGDIGRFINTTRFLSKSFNAAVTTDFNGTPMTSYANSTDREVFLDWALRRLEIQTGRHI